MKTRIITALLIVACVVPPLLFGGIFIQALISFIIVTGGIELLKLTEHDGTWPIGLKPLMIGSVFLLLCVETKLQMPVLGAVVLMISSIPVFTDRFHAKDGFLCIAYVILFFMFAEAFLNIYDANRMYVWFILFATYGCDTAAYFCGRFFGKHKLNVRISPKKTWEGSIGGWFVGTIAATILGVFLIDSLTFLQLLVAASILAMTGQIGDLAFSAIKRCFNIKDFSNLLPGHGGVLDRIDSLVFNFICFSLILTVVTL